MSFFGYSILPPPPPPGLGSLTVLQQYGEVSRVSHTHSWSSEGVPPELPLPPLGQEDMAGGLDMKLEWITELVSRVYTPLNVP